jgi:site-specific DNA recombinase
MLAAVYARQSVDKADSVSIQTQTERCAAVCAAHGWQWELYSDRGFSGKSMERPAFKRLLADTESGKIKAVVSYKLDRVSRSMADFSRLLEMFSLRGVEYVSATEQFDTSSPTGRAMIYIIMVFAQLERETITQRVSDNYRYRAAMGLYMGGGVPFGYKAVRTYASGRKVSLLELDKSKESMIKNIYEVFLDGANTRQTAEKLALSGFRAPKGGKLTASTVSRILRNMTYCADEPEIYSYLKSQGYAASDPRENFDGRRGMCVSLKTRRGISTGSSERIAAIGAHEPVIRARDWIAVQRRLDASAHGTKRTRPSSRGWLAGLIRCKECGGSFGFKSCGEKYSYYFCRSGCGRWIDSAALEKVVGENLLERAHELIRQVLQGENTDAAKIGQIKAKLQKLRRELDDVVSSIGGGAEFDEALANKVKALGNEYRNTAERLSVLTADHCAAQAKVTAKYCDISLVFSLSEPALKRRLARLLIDRIDIYPADGSQRKAAIYFK